MISHNMVLRLFVLLTTLSAVSWIAVSWQGMPSSDFWFWLGVCLVAELLWVRLPLGGATLSMASCCNFAALLMLPRAEAMLAVAASVFVSELLFVRKPLQKVVFNSSQTALAVGAASMFFVLLGGRIGNPISIIAGVNILPALAAAVSYFLINSGMVSMAVSQTHGTSFISAWWENYGNRFEFISNGALFSLGILFALLYSISGITGLFLILLPMMVAYEGYKRMVQPESTSDYSEDKAA